MGEINFSRRTVDGDTWTCTGETKINGQPIRSRLTLKRVNDDSAAYKFEMAPGSDPLVLIMDDKQTRQK